MKDLYTIQLASRISGVGVHTIRAWEKRYSAVTPKRNGSGRRVYNEGEIERLSMLSELCSLGHTIGHIANWSNEDLKANLKKLGRLEISEGMGPQIIVDKKTARSNESLDNLLMALKHYKLDIISHEFNKLKLVLSPKQLAFDIIQPLMYEVGKAISEGEITLSQEQALMSLIKFHLGSALYRQMQHKSKKPHAIVLTTTEGDHNEMVILLAALLCAHYNLNFYYLGANLPASSLIDATISIDASHIILGTTPRLDMRENFLNNYIQNLLEKVPDDKTIVLRGSASFSYEKLPQNNKLVSTKSLRELDQYLKTV